MPILRCIRQTESSIPSEFNASRHARDMLVDAVDQGPVEIKQKCRVDPGHLLQPRLVGVLIKSIRTRDTEVIAERVIVEL